MKLTFMSVNCINFVIQVMETSKQRVAKHRMSLKSDPVKFQKYLEKERTRDRKRRADKKILMSQQTKKARKLLTAKRKRDAERQKKCREKKKNRKLRILFNHRINKVAYLVLIAVNRHTAKL